MSDPKDAANAARDEKEEPQGLSAYQRLFDAIRAGKLAPGARIREAEIAEWLGVSRTPVREAIRRLEAEGLIVHAPRQGAVVKMLDHQEVIELYEMRAVLEGAAARLAARHASELEIDELNELNALMGATDDVVERAQVNRRFHMALLDGAKNRYLARSMNAISTTLLVLGPTTLSDETRAVEAVEEHQSIIEAVIRRDPQAAEAAAQSHIRNSQKLRLRALREARVQSETA